MKAKLEKIVEVRRAQVPRVQERIDGLDSVESNLATVVDAATTLPADWQSDAEIRDAVDRLKDPEIAMALATARMELSSVAARFSRESVNVGVSGRARVGKSLMLQSISGLSDEQVPTGAGVNVTAVRSRIFNAASPGASISFHTRTSFFEDVVRPYFSDLKISPMPSTLEGFEGLAARPVGQGFSTLERMYEDARSAGFSKQDKARWDRMLEIAHTLPQLRLDGGELRLDDLSDLRRYVAYPTTTDKDREDLKSEYRAPRDYLSVRDCRIESPFPVSSLERLALVDLPGAGESAAGIDERIVSGLRGEVDVVMMVFRSVEGLANIDTIDREALDLITAAQGPISDSRDFAWIVVNTAPGEGDLRSALVSELHRDFNERIPDSRYIVLTANAADPRSMHEGAVLPVLNRLVDRLPRMDLEILGGAVATAEAPLRQLQAATARLQEALRAAGNQSGTPWQQLNQLAPELLKDVQSSLALLRPRQLVEKYVLQYLDEIDSIHVEVRDWLTSGLGRFEDRADWIDYADREWGVRQSHGPFANEELHRLRVEITSRYAQLDSYLNDVLVEDFYSKLADLLAGHTPGTTNVAGAERGYLLGDPSGSGSGRLGAFSDRLKDCNPAVPRLVRAVDRLRGIHFDFRMQSLPLLHDLNLQMRPQEDTDPPFPPPFDREATPYMYDWFLEEFTQYSFRVRRELHDDAHRQFAVLSGAALLFEDELARSGASAAEFRNLVDGYRDELWPGRFTGMNTNSARAQRVHTTVNQLGNAIGQALEVAS